MREIPAGKKTAIIAYLTFIGLIIAYYKNRNEPTEYAGWHIKNMFGLLLLLLISQVSQAYVDLLLGELLWLLAFALWLFSLIMVVQNNKKAIPYFSEKFQQWFTFLD
jgi:uncharacterized membrane protein